jgi:ribosomal protein S6
MTNNANNNEDKDRKEYELALLLKNEDNLAGVVTLVNQHNAEGMTEPRAKRLQLAYEIKKLNEAVFVYFTFKAFGDDIKALESDLNQRADVLRFMVIASPAPAERPSSGMMPHDRRSSAPSSASSSAPRSAPRTMSAASESKPAASRPLSNEALEKKIEEILK